MKFPSSSVIIQFLPTTIYCLLLFLVFFEDVNSAPGSPKAIAGKKNDGNCRVEIVETMPTGMHFDGTTTFKSTFDSWMELLKMARHSIDMSVFYWELLTDVNAYKPAIKGLQIYEEIERAIQRGVQIRIVQSVPKPEQDETRKLAEKYPGKFQVRIIDISKFIGIGYLHQKAWIVDGQHAYLGSANMDWGSFTDMAELGVEITHCDPLVKDIERVFLSYWSNAEDYRNVNTKWVTEERKKQQKQEMTSSGKKEEEGKKIGVNLSSALETAYNSKNPLQIALNEIPSGVYVNNSPAAFNPNGREHTLSGIVHQLNRAEQFIRIAVRDILPITTKHLVNGKQLFVPEIDNALRAAAVRGVKVELLVGIKVYKAFKKRQGWDNEFLMNAFLRSLCKLMPHSRSSEYSLWKRFNVPQSEMSSHSRMMHMKYMVTDKAAYIATFNWDSDSFYTVSGMGLCIENRSENNEGHPIIAELEQNFERNWHSEYTTVFELVQN